MEKSRGFTLIELLIIIAIFAIAGWLFAGILPVFLKFQNQQTATNEIGTQLNFVIQTIQRLVRESSLALVNDDGNKDNDALLGQPHSRLVLRTATTTTDATSVWLEGGTVKIKEGNSEAVAITTADVQANQLTFIKNSHYPGHDTIQINLTLSRGLFSRSLQSAIGRVSAATFDSSLLPGADKIWDVGQGSTRWRNGNLSGDLEIGGNVFDLFNCNALCEKDIVTGLVWDDNDRTATWWNTASNTCLTKGARLPTVGELYQRSFAAGTARWTGDVASTTLAFTVDATSIGTDNITASTKVYRCVR